MGLGSLAEGQHSLPHPRRFFRRRTIHRLASEIENTKRRPSCNHQTTESMESHPPSQSPVAERTQTGVRTAPRVYTLLRKPLGKRHLAGMSGARRPFTNGTSSRNGTADSRVFRRFPRDARSDGERRSRTDLPSSVTDVGKFANPKRLPPPRFVRFRRITLKVFRFLGGWQRPAWPYLYIERCRNGPWKTRRTAKRPCIRPTKQIIRPDRRGGRVVEGAPLLREYTSKAYRGFESLPLRHFPLVGSPPKNRPACADRCRAFRRSLPPSAGPEKACSSPTGRHAADKNPLCN